MQNLLGTFWRKQILNTIIGLIEIGPINENSKWPSGGHLVIFINMNFSKVQLDIKGEVSKLRISSFRGNEGKTLDFTEINENSKWPSFFHNSRQIRQHTS